MKVSCRTLIALCPISGPDHGRCDGRHTQEELRSSRYIELGMDHTATRLNRARPLVFAHRSHTHDPTRPRSHTSSIPHVPPCPGALTPDYVRNTFDRHVRTKFLARGLLSNPPRPVIIILMLNGGVASWLPPFGLGSWPPPVPSLPSWLVAFPIEV